MLRQSPRRARRGQVVAATAACLALSSMIAADAFAACTRLAFSVNDYGKIGPTNDAKNLLDKYIAKWAADRKIKGYNVGPKEVTCELFLDVGLFDEYTCKAAATVCWNGPLPPGHVTDAGPASPHAAKAAQGAPSRAKAAPKAAAEGDPKPPAAISTGSVRTVPAAASSAAPPAEAPRAGPPTAARSVVPGAPAAPRPATPAAAPRPAPIAPTAN